nr:MAG TPA: hypothetical protein [Caudoviricetes sp.]
MVLQCYMNSKCQENSHFSFWYEKRIALPSITSRNLVFV